MENQHMGENSPPHIRKVTKIQQQQQNELYNLFKK